MAKSPKDTDDTESTSEAEKAAQNATSDVPAGVSDKSVSDKTQEPESLDTALKASSLIMNARPAQTPVHDHVAGNDDYELEDEEHDDLGGSLASKILTGLVLLIAGAGIALWGGPKIAPSLPAGLGTLKTFLMPGESTAQQEIAQLREEFEQYSPEMPEGITQADIDQAIEARLAAQETSVTAQITDLKDQLAAVDGASVKGRLVAIENRLEGIVEQLESLGSLAETADGLSEDTVAQLGRFTSVVEGLRAELADLATRDGALTQRIDEVEAKATRRIGEAETAVETAMNEADTAQKNAAVENSLTAIEAALITGDTSYRAALNKLESAISFEIPAVLTENADAGIPTLARLRAQFSDTAHAAIRADIEADANSGTIGRVNAFLGSQFASRSLTPQEGPGTDAVLSRAEDALRRDDLSVALTELSALPDSAVSAMSGWIADANARLQTTTALHALREGALATN